MQNQQSSAVDFAGSSRIHVGLAVSDMERSKRFYETLLNVKPSKERPGYAKFEPADPSVNLSLNQVPRGTALPSAPTLRRPSQVQRRRPAAQARLLEAGFETRVEEQTTCCYAVQDKVWATDPDGNPWEVFVVTERDADRAMDADSTCCQTESDGHAREAACCVRI